MLFNDSYIKEKIPNKPAGFLLSSHSILWVLQSKYLWVTSLWGFRAFSSYYINTSQTDCLRMSPEEANITFLQSPDKTQNTITSIFTFERCQPLHHLTEYEHWRFGCECGLLCVCMRMALIERKEQKKKNPHKVFSHYNIPKMFTDII